MTTEKSTVEADLAFLRGLVTSDNDAGWRQAFGRAYALWGFAFLVPLLIEWTRLIGLISLPGWFWPVAAVLVVVFAVAASILMNRRAARPTGAPARAANAIFGGVGWANLAVLVALVVAAGRLEDSRVLMVHAVVVFAFQGAAWYAVWALRKIAWTGFVAAGWLIAAVASAVTLGHHLFVLVVSASLLLLMALPGLYMARTKT